MGLLGVLKESRDQSTFNVRAIHFNLWVLPLSFPKACKYGFPPRELNFYMDIGLRLEVTGVVRWVDIHLPTFVDAYSFQDLGGRILDEGINDLIFGTEVKSANNTITYPGASVDEEEIKETVLRIASFAPETEWRPVYRIEFPAIVKGNPNKPTNAYTRFRVRVPEPSRIWILKGWGQGKRGAIFDLRVSDVREGLPHDAQPSIAVLFKPVARFFGFLIIPVSYHPGIFSPDLYYSRLLEADVWRPYLEGCEFDPSEKLAIHEWRSSKDRPVDYKTPFRAYMHLHREFGWAVIVYVVLAYLAGVFPQVVAAIWKFLFR